jgi:GR25 family glycosyltransferase involved in LPS biosynthesis
MIDITKIPVYCINLDSRPQRFLRFLEQEGIQGLTIQRVAAVDGSRLQIVKNSKISIQTQYNIINHTRRSHGEINTPGAIGCSLSHYSIWEKFLQTDKPYCLVLEDDASIPKGFAESIVKYSKDLDQLQSIFDVWSLGSILLEILSGFPLWLSLKSRVQSLDGYSKINYGLFGVAGRDN